MATDRSIFDNIVNSLGYKTTVGPQDKAKVAKAIAGQPSTKPASRLGLAAWDLARRISPVTPPPPPPPDPIPLPTYKKVAPRVAYKAGGSDARFCCINQPGVVRDGGGWRDDVASYDDNGLCTSGTRSDGPAMTSALEIDGRDYCSLPTTGDPTKNTGSWEI